MSNTEEKKKAKQWKVGITEVGWIELNRFLELANGFSKRRIKAPEVLELAVQKLSEVDVPKLQARVYTAEDKIDLALQQYNEQHKDKPLTREEFLNSMLESYQTGSRLKSTRRVAADEKQV